VASLLEVGTGMHGELTGRENIYLNGTILGMRRHEIDRKFDEIIDFAGIERYLDTPVKRYSSGMFIRLGFAVAAFLEPEILIVDEVLAVGDAEFQRKCLGKMRDVSQGEGRTILFVSHNMTAVKNLCQTAVLLKNGMLAEQGEVNEIIQSYEKSVSLIKSVIRYDSPEQAPGNEQVRLKKLEIVSADPHGVIYVDTPVKIHFEFWNFETSIPINLSLHVYNHLQECVFNVGTQSKTLGKGVYSGTCIIPENFLNDNFYQATMMVVGDSSYAIFNFDDPISFQVLEKREKSGWHGKHPGYIRPQLPFTLEPLL
jgi:lipopolysaccharide transport system ATP-binding protein